MIQKNVKRLGVFFGIIIVAGLIVWGFGYYRYTQTPEYAVEKYYKELKTKYAADTYGGDTPEETLRLFIDALKKGDIELASKYFVIEEQDEKLADLKIGKERGSLEKIVGLLEKADYPSKYPDGKSYDISIIEKDDTIKFGVHLVLNELTKKWKIESL